MPEARSLKPNLLSRARSDERGGVAMVFAFTLPLLLGVAGVTSDYATLSSHRTKLQAIADSSALAAAREFRLGNANATTLSQAVNSHANGSLASHDISATVRPTVDIAKRSITVELGSDAPTFVLKYLGADAARVEARATARMVGGAPICVIGLNQFATSTIEMDKLARLEAPNCAVYSNSKKPTGIIAKNNSVLRAAFICSAGGKSAPTPGSFVPTPQTDCPLIPDPLLPRALPSASGCIENNLVRKGGSITLSPGTYCGGANFSNGTRVTLSAGTYIFKDGPLVVTGGASLQGTNVALHFSGHGAVINFEAASSIAITAPRTGSMAGILISEDRSGPAGLSHTIMSDDARTLLGTIYLPRGRLFVGANKPVADRSAYTIIVANRFSLSEGPTMVLNTNYGATDVPVPEGVGPLSAKMVLSQ